MDMCRKVGRNFKWVTGFVIGFDDRGYDAEDYEIIVDHLQVREEDWNRGYRAGWCCAARVFAKAPVEACKEQEPSFSHSPR